MSHNGCGQAENGRFVLWFVLDAFPRKAGLFATKLLGGSYLRAYHAKSQQYE